ncbi:MAG TPA: hypothetical protein VHA56_14230 [Mucilaginibacter sp.]|nr:hypothetical protein [Mucilaginibacter sp.]
MKKIILAAAVLFAAGFATAKANSLPVQQQSVISVSRADTLKKTPVKLEELPDPIKTVLQTDVFKTWIPSDAYSVTDGTNQYFEVDVKKGTETKELKFDKDGKIIQ